MDFEYSPHRSAGGTMHLLSPTHHSKYADPFPSIRQIRRSLSRSPSKPSRYQMHNLSSPKQTSPRSPSALSRAFSLHAASEMDLSTEPVAKPKFTLRKAAPMKVAPRKTSPNSPMRRALSNGHSQGNTKNVALPFRGFADGQENMTTTPADAAKNMRFELDSEPIKFDLLKAHADKPSSLNIAMKDHLTPAKSSPLKRSDGLMNLDQPALGSPRAKRRSLHGAAFGSDFNVFELGFDGNSDNKDSSSAQSGDGATFAASPRPQRSPQRRPFSLRRSTLQQRNGGSAGHKASQEASESRASSAPVQPASPALSRSGSRISLDSVLPVRSLDPMVSPAPEPRKPSFTAPKPHPLSKALSPSSSASSLTDEPFTLAPQNPTPNGRPKAGFSKSLPIGALRPRLDTSGDSFTTSSTESFETPEAFKMARPLPTAFMSTGLISKRNRNMDLAPASFNSSVNMPDTPSKRMSMPNVATPAHASVFANISHPKHEFGSPTTPFSPHVFKGSPESFGKGVSIFGSRVAGGKLIRRSSFLSIEGDDPSNSPTAKMDSQVPTDDLPPTPTKPANTGPRPQSKGKGNSLRSSLLGRRSSLAPDTFVSPDNDVVAPPMTRESSLEPPVTPSESFTPPDASRLSISGEMPNQTNFATSVRGFPPATPTGPRDHPFNFSVSQPAGSSSMFQNDVDTTLTGRFGSVHVYGIGEFSMVYRVENPLPNGPAAALQSPSSVGKVWAVKKSKKPYTGSKDRARKMKEVQILKALKGTEHVIEAVDTWEMKNHLYIQTEFCENGNLKDFLSQAGYKARLDDFRIWKILLELSQGIQCIHNAGYIHLDLKPANIFIDWEGVLKIGDFGMASVWPAPPHLDGEGDREYIAPEVLSGRFDKPADVFALGMIMLEIAGNIVLPDNGSSWQRLRSGDMSDLPSLTFSTDSSLVRDESGDPVSLLNNASSNTMASSAIEDDDDDDLGFCSPQPVATPRPRDLVQPPPFMVDVNHDDALDKLLHWLISPNPEERPTIDQLLGCGGVQWVAERRRAGATIYEGNWGPADDVLNHAQDVEMLDI